MKKIYFTSTMMFIKLALFARCSYKTERQTNFVGLRQFVYDCAYFVQMFGKFHLEINPLGRFMH
jgi:hypothetical protein